MSEVKKYRPSNGSEGDYFITSHCYNCIHGKYEHTGDTNDNPCDILTRSFMFDIDDKEYPEEWIENKDGSDPRCTAFKKWDWGRDDDGNFKEPPPPPTDDPNQLCMPFIFDELEIKEPEVQVSDKTEGE